jgi:hypothetical protein
MAFEQPGSYHISESLETIFWVKILKFFDADPGSGMEKIRTRDRKNRVLPQVLYSYPMVRYTDMEDPMRREVMDVCTLACERHPSNNEMVSAYWVCGLFFYIE